MHAVQKNYSQVTDMAGYNTTEALYLIMENSFEELDSGGEEDIDEDPAFPLPSQEYEVSG